MNEREESLAASPATAADDLALVMSGGGARAAYQVGVLRAIARHLPDLAAPILTGVSAGAVNAAFLANSPEPFARRASDLAEFWSELEVEAVFDVHGSALLGNAFRWGLRLLSGGRHGVRPLRGLVDTTPLRELLRRALAAGPDGTLGGVEGNLAAGRLRALAVTASSYTTGQTVTWVQGRRIRTWERPSRVSVQTRVAVDHVMASSALPFLFPAVEVAGAWYGDGGIRLSAPLSPAIHLGASRILAISTRYPRSRTEAQEPEVVGYPPPAQVAGVLLNAIFLDLLDGDALRLERINHLLEELEGHRAAPYADDLRRVGLLVVRPSCDLGKLANEHEARLPRAFRFLTRGLGTRDTRSNDLLSLLMFQADYLNRLLDLGEADAESRMDELRRFLSPAGPDPAPASAPAAP